MESAVSVAQKINISEVVKEYGKRLKAFINKRVRSLEDSEDILQEVYYQLSETDNMMKPVDHVASWLFTVARNRITDLYRKKKTSSFSDTILENDDEEMVMDEISELIYYLGNTPEDQFLQSMIRRELEKTLTELPPEQRVVFEMNELMGISFKEISLATGETVNTLISRKRYAVLYLRKRLQPLYDEIINT